jgi:hypothetical protein
MCCLTCFDIPAAYKLENRLVPNLNNVEQSQTRFRAVQLLISAGRGFQMTVHYKNDLTIYRVFHRNVASRNRPLKTDHHQNVYFRLPDVVTTGLNTSLGPPHPLKKNLGQG